MKILALLVGLPVLLAGGAASATLIIDDFEVGPFSLATPDSPISQTGLPVPNVIGGQRDVSVRSFLSGSSTTVSLVLSGGDDAAALASTFNGGVATFAYPLLGVTDLTVGGTLDRFEIVVSAVDESFCATPTNCQVDVAHGSGGTLTFARVEVVNDGVVSLPYSAFGGRDFTQVQEVRLLPIVRGEGGFSVAEFRAVPEPSTALLFASALMMLALQRRLA